MKKPESIPLLITAAGQVQEMLTADAYYDIAAFLSSVNDARGGFHDRAGKSDLFYTAFGLSSFTALKITIPRVEIERGFLDDYPNREAMSFIDLISLIRCYKCLQLAGIAEPISNGRRRKLLEQLEQYRTADGGFSHEHKHAGQCSAYAVFLAMQAYQDVGSPRQCPALPGIMSSIEGLRAHDGGYSNHPGSSRGLTTASAAAAVLFAQAGNLDAACKTLEYLEKMRTPAGGYQAALEAPCADLLSTAAVLYARYLCSRPLREKALNETAAFVERLWSEEGGFRASLEDPVPDVEYTFYALLALGSLYGSK